MCRWVLYKGSQVKIADVITRPEHSLVDQASHAVCYTPGVETSRLYNREQRKARDHTLNADGFGLGWYSLDGVVSERRAPTPSLVKSCAPPWSSATLFEVAESTETGCIFAHIRAASPGLRVSEANCHPFRFGRFMFMHNGSIGGFSQIKESLRACLRTDVLNLIEGTTDSEHAFALFVNHFPDQGVHGPFNRYVSPEWRAAAPFPAETLIAAMRATIATIRTLQKTCNVSYEESLSSLNFAVTDGTTILATRCRTHPEQDPPSLYYSFGSSSIDLLGKSSSSSPRERSGSDPSPASREHHDEVLRRDLHLHRSPRPRTFPVQDTLVIASEPPIFLNEFTSVSPSRSRRGRGGGGKGAPRGWQHASKHGYTLVPKE
jgi:glutamine amidotransferase